MKLETLDEKEDRPYKQVEDYVERELAEIERDNQFISHRYEGILFRYFNIVIRILLLIARQQKRK